MKKFLSIMLVDKMTIKQHMVVFWVVMSLVLASCECEHWWLRAIAIASLVASLAVARNVLSNLDIDE